MNKNYEFVSNSDLSVQDQIKIIQKILCKNDNYPEVVKPVPKTFYDYSLTPKKKRVTQEVGE